MNGHLFVFTGKIKTGKTTSLGKWVLGKSAEGILQPVKNGKRYFHDIKSGEEFLMNALPEDSSPIVLGDYRFAEDAFIWGREKLTLARSHHSDWIIVDEYGKLEEKSMGLEPVVSELVNDFKNRKDFNLLIVVRDYLLYNFYIKQKLSKEEVFVINSPEKLFYI
jgi:nucleoside-triphosphatase THEP1